MIPKGQKKFKSITKLLKQAQKGQKRDWFNQRMTKDYSFVDELGKELFFVTRDNWSGTILRIPSDYRNGGHGG